MSIKDIIGGLDVLELATKVDPIIAAKLVRVFGLDAQVRLRVNSLYPWLKSFGLALGAESVVLDDKKAGPP